MLNRWNYTNLGQVKYGGNQTYSEPIAWFDEVGGVLEDWGCGCAYAKRFVKRCNYVGLEGSCNDYADRCDVDLRTYTSKADCILLRHVLDHNEDWRSVLANGVQSFQKRMVVILLHDLGPETKVIIRHGSVKFPGVVDMQFRREDLVPYLSPFLVREQRIQADDETPNNNVLFYLEKK